MRSVSGVAALPTSICPQTDIERPAVERGLLGQPGDRVLGRRVCRGHRARRVRRDRAVVDDASAARALRLHDAERFLRAQEGPGEVGIDDELPALDRQILERHRRGADSRVVEQEVEPPERLFRFGEQRLDRGRIGDVGRHDQAFRRRAFLGGLLEFVLAPPGQHHGVARLHQRQRRRLADAGPRAGDERDALCGHAESSG